MRSLRYSFPDAMQYRTRTTGVAHGETKCESSPHVKPMNRTANGAEKLRTPDNQLKARKMSRATPDPIPKWITTLSIFRVASDVSPGASSIQDSRPSPLLDDSFNAVSLLKIVACTEQLNIFSC